MSLIFISIAILAIAIFLMSFNIIFRKDGEFPETEVGRNKEMRKKGLRCAKGEEKALWRKKKTPQVSYSPTEGCSSHSCCCGD
ncbi:MAG: hypothetical protein WCR61_00180 [Bacteroidales bacterium]|nr:hypothetical protein [Bacteroidales bacterium]MDD4656925.1 hypothetical protein [Bacteroidales bacterium]